MSGVAPVCFVNCPWKNGKLLMKVSCDFFIGELNFSTYCNWTMKIWNSSQLWDTKFKTLKTRTWTLKGLISDGGRGINWHQNQTINAGDLEWASLIKGYIKKNYDYKAYNNANSVPNNDNGTWFSDAHIQLYRPVQAEIGGGSGDICGANPCNPNQDCGAAHTVRHCYSKWSMHHPRNTISLIFQNTICQKTAPHPACQKLPP